MKKILSSSLVFFLLMTGAATAEPVEYKIDSVHSGISFKIRHFINKVPGSFSKYDGTIQFDKENPENSKTSATIQVSSIDTGNNNRDEHLQNEDFFMASEYPTITFESTEWTEVGENQYKVDGLLTIRGEEKPVELDVTFLGEIEGRGKLRSGWEITTTIDRTNWGMDYGTGMVGSEVQIEINLQAHRDIPEKE